MQFGIYKDVQLLNNEADRELKIDEINGFDYASNLRDCVITTDEFFEAAKSQPIVFAKNSESGEFFATALLGLKKEKNLFVKADESWCEGEYIPAFIRRYPFIFVQQGEQLALALDRDHPAVGADEGQALFDEAGERTEYTEKVLAFMQLYQLANARTQVLIRKLDEMGLLEEATAQIRQEGEQFSFTGFMRVNEEKLNALSDEQTLDLVRDGSYKWVVAHLMSLSNFNKLIALGAE